MIVKGWLQRPVRKRSAHVEFWGMTPLHSKDFSGEAGTWCAEVLPADPKIGKGRNPEPEIRPK